MIKWSKTNVLFCLWDTLYNICTVIGLEYAGISAEIYDKDYGTRVAWMLEFHNLFEI